jgi:predicted nucleic acid-binding protein
MPILVDTNVLIRLRDASSPDHLDCVRCLHPEIIRARGLVIFAQVLIEFWAVATRPKDVNGVGLTAAEADADLSDLLKILPCLGELPDVLSRWRQLVLQFGVLGRQAHDARLVAAMDLHGISTILTLNRADFARYSHIHCLAPSELLVT